MEEHTLLWVVYMSSTLSKQINVPGICDSACLKKFETLLSQRFTIVEGDIPSHMRFKAKLERTGLPREVHVEIFTNENTSIKASPDVKTFFPGVCAEIMSILKESVNILSRQDTVRVKRAGRILKYVRNISVQNEIERMVIVTLCDIILDLLVTEKLSHFTTKRQHLEHESVGAKLGMLEKQFRIPIYRPKAVRDIRGLRNRVAHGGASPATEEATFAKEATIDVFGLF